MQQYFSIHKWLEPADIAAIDGMTKLFDHLGSQKPKGPYPDYRNSFLQHRHACF
ncbi:hypothetical protein [Rhizobium sp. LEGMi135b]